MSMDDFDPYDVSREINNVLLMKGFGQKAWSELYAWLTRLTFDLSAYGDNYYHACRMARHCLSGGQPFSRLSDGHLVNGLISKARAHRTKKGRDSFFALLNMPHTDDEQTR